MATGELHRTGLRSFLPEFLGEDDLGADVHLGEASIDDAVLVEVDLTSVESLEESEAAVGEESRDLGVGRRLVRLDMAAVFIGVILELASGVVEGFMNRAIELLVFELMDRVSFHDEFSAWHFQVDADLVQVSFLVVPVRHVDDDADSSEFCRRRTRDWPASSLIRDSTASEGCRLWNAIWMGKVMVATL